MGIFKHITDDFLKEISDIVTKVEQTVFPSDIDLMGRQRAELNFLRDKVEELEAEVVMTKAKLVEAEDRRERASLRINAMKKYHEREDRKEPD